MTIVLYFAENLQSDCSFLLCAVWAFSRADSKGYFYTWRNRDGGCQREEIRLELGNKLRKALS